MTPCPWGPCTSSSYRRCTRSGVERFDPADGNNCGSPLCGNVAPDCPRCGAPSVHRHGYVEPHAPEDCLQIVAGKLTSATNKIERAVTFLQHTYVREGWQSIADLLVELGAEVPKL